MLFCRGWHEIFLKQYVPFEQYAYFFLVHPMKFFIYGVVVIAPVVDAKTP